MSGQQRMAAQQVLKEREEAKRFLAAASDTHLGAMWILALSTGMRLGELLALQWANVNLQQRTLRITRTLSRRPIKVGGMTSKKTKTESSTRTIPMTSEVAEALRQHKSKQAQERLMAGPVWVDNDLVFCNEVGAICGTPTCESMRSGRCSRRLASHTCARTTFDTPQRRSSWRPGSAH